MSGALVALATAVAMAADTGGNIVGRPNNALLYQLLDKTVKNCRNFKCIQLELCNTDPPGHPAICTVDGYTCCCDPARSLITHL